MSEREERREGEEKRRAGERGREGEKIGKRRGERERGASVREKYVRRYQPCTFPLFP